ncbi:hypothetical protein F4802DRAFT_555403 [Xylaria palmicola]|nr:hypothetical protein F4802DRAFT_555403 [Xylaria palmicola]
MAGLNQVPVEVLENIIQWTLTSKAGRLAAVHPTWQSIIEKTTFQEISIESWELSIAFGVFRQRPERFGLVRRLIYRLVLPPYTAADCKVMETGQDRFKNDLVFSKYMKQLFSYLVLWPPTGRTLELQLYPYSPNDRRCLIGNKWHRYFYGPVRGDLLHNRSHGSALELYMKDCEAAPAVTKLTLRDDCERYIAVTGFDCMFRTFTGLRDIDVRFWDYYKTRQAALRRSNHRAMGKALDNMPSSVGSMRFYVKYYTPADQRYDGQRVCQGDESDPLTTAYRKATQQMTIVDAHGLLGTPELFWPKKLSADSPEPVWPRLKYMELYYHILNPSGEWLFEPDSTMSPRQQADLPLHGLPAKYTPEEDMHPFQNRYTATQEKMDDFYSAVAKAVANMPKLAYLRLQAITYWSGNIAPFHVFEFSTDGRTGRATWSGTPPFEPGADVLEAWRKMADKRGLLISLESKKSK